MARALLVGINEYPGCPLNGCVNDVYDVANTLFSLGIVENSLESLQILTDQRATRTGILGGLAWLISGAKPGDRLIWYYSGHGTQIPDQNGDEIDEIDEALVPVDYENGMLTDDDIAEVLGRLPAGVHLEIIFDSCFSGTCTRSPPVGTVRYLPPPPDEEFHITAAAPYADHRAFVTVRTLNHVLIAASRPDQTSTETIIDEVDRGAFTYHFCKCLRGAGAGVTRKKLMSQVALNMRRAGFAQIPQLESTKHKKNGVIFT